MNSKIDSFDDIFAWAEKQDEYRLEGVKIEFTEEVVAQLKALGLTRAELAKRLGTSPAYVTKVLGGSTNFTLESMVRIAQALGCELRTHLQPNGAKSQWFDMLAGNEATAAEPSYAPAHVAPASDARLANDQVQEAA